MTIKPKLKKKVAVPSQVNKACVHHDVPEEASLEKELMEVEKLWIREKAELEDGLEVERTRIAQLARELGEF